MTPSSTTPNYVNHLENNQLSDYTFYKSTHHNLFRESDLLFWIGIIVDPKTTIILDCKWHSINHLDFKDELIYLSNRVVGLPFDSLRSIDFKSTILKQLFTSLSSSV